MTALTRGASDRPVIGPAVQGLLAAVAIGSLTSSERVDTNAAVMFGIIMGVVAAIFSVGGVFETVAQAVFSAIGVIAFFPAALAFADDKTCGHAIATPLRFAMLALLVVLAGISFVARRLMAGRRPHVSMGLSLFGALQILVATADFIEGSGSRPELLAMAAMVLGAAVLGWLVAVAPDAVLGVGAAAVGMQTIYGASTGSMCGQQSYSGVVLLVVFGAAFFATRAVTSSLSPRR